RRPPPRPRSYGCRSRARSKVASLDTTDMKKGDTGPRRPTLPCTAGSSRCADVASALDLLGDSRKFSRFRVYLGLRLGAHLNLGAPFGSNPCHLLHCQKTKIEEDTWKDTNCEDESLAVLRLCSVVFSSSASYSLNRP